MKNWYKINWPKKDRHINSPKAMWLIALLSVTLLMPLTVSGKYRSEFSQTVDIVVYPALTMAGIPEDGEVIDDTGLSLDDSFMSATPSEATPSEATPSEATPFNATSSVTTPAETVSSVAPASESTSFEATPSEAALSGETASDVTPSYPN